MENLKQQVGIEAARYVTDGMRVGLGTGSTAAFFVEELARRVREEKLNITAVTTSTVTTAQAESLGIKISDLSELEGELDLTVDGADEFDSALNGIKGGGGALLMEKIVASLSKDYIWIVDESKEVAQLGKFPLPVEVVQFGAENLFRKFEASGYLPTWRMTMSDDNDNGRFITDQGHFIIDLHLQKIENAEALALKLDQTVGVVEHGLFINMAKHVIVAGKDGIKTITK
ncbi:MAG: ribose-5-phosphate isomerase RpiA [Streptococcaceae bacterium]|jgi:ribose 5-phosphate isomerase A|nr:ribose-5-phosphate isomerase RpiA [Streptococcaceae bacterium]